MSISPNVLSQALDVAGSVTKNQDFSLEDERLSLGTPVSGQVGSSASVAATDGSVVVMTGLSGMVTQSVGRFLEVSNASDPDNNGVFLVVEFVSSTSVKVYNTDGSAPDLNNGSISWKERYSYSLEDDINAARTDRAAIKGVDYYAPVPEYDRPTALGSLVPADLSNVAGKTTDARAFVRNKLYAGVTVSTAVTKIKLSDPGELPHAGLVDRTGVPVFDGADAGRHEATYAEIRDAVTGGVLRVLGGADAGKRIYGRTITGSSISPNEVEVEFRAVEGLDDLGSSVQYSWELGQSAEVDMVIGFRERLDDLDENALRNVLWSAPYPDKLLHEFVADCPVAVVVGTWVYISGPTISGVYQVKEVDISDSIKVPAVGVVVEKLSSTSCRVMWEGELSGVFPSLTPRRVYFIQSDGSISTVPPTSGYGYYVQRVGVALSSGTLLVTPNYSLIKRP